MDKQINLTEDDFDWNHDVDMPNRLASKLDPDLILKIKRLKAVINTGYATQKELAEYTQLRTVK